MADEEIRSLESNVLILGLLMQKYHKDLKYLLNIAEDIFEYFSKLESTGNLQTTYYAYLFDLFKEKIMQKFEETVWPTADRTKNYIMQLMDKSIAEGKEKGKDLTIKNLIQEGFDNVFISRVAEVTPQHVESIRQDLKNS